MKKVISIIILITIMFSLVACVSRSNIINTGLPEYDDEDIQYYEKQDEVIEENQDELIEENQDEVIDENQYDAINEEKRDFEDLVKDAYAIYDILYGRGAPKLIDESSNVNNEEYLPTTNKKIESFASWEAYLKGLFSEEIAENILEDSVIKNQDGNTYVKTGHVPQYVEWELAEDYLDTMVVSNNVIKVKMVHWEDPFEEPKEETLEVYFTQTDDRLIIFWGSFIERLFIQSAIKYRGYAVDEATESKYIKDTDAVFKEFLQALYSNNIEKAKSFLTKSLEISGYLVTDGKGLEFEFNPSDRIEERSYSYTPKEDTHRCAYKYYLLGTSSVAYLEVEFVKNSDGKWLISGIGLNA